LKFHFFSLFGVVRRALAGLAMLLLLRTNRESDAAR